MLNIPGDQQETGNFLQEQKNSFICLNHSNLWTKCSCLYLDCNLVFQQACSQVSSNTQLIHTCTLAEKVIVSCTKLFLLFLSLGF